MHNQSGLTLPGWWCNNRLLFVSHKINVQVFSFQRGFAAVTDAWGGTRNPGNQAGWHDGQTWNEHSPTLRASITYHVLLWGQPGKLALKSPLFMSKSTYRSVLWGWFSSYWLKKKPAFGCHLEINCSFTSFVGLFSYYFVCFSLKVRKIK